ncbi:DUF305 domain-containing protein [Saccharomonospora iraqiensis]|uniref:DUF305 domain-containing protein n=1 Tax=Saccharomonospora iraqiensis TaxID=52698 RepID=UPI00022E7BFF|nr:DUF305 domain-containing protein [Saccharomonospora iraqiensis]
MHRNAKYTVLVTTMAAAVATGCTEGGTGVDVSGPASAAQSASAADRATHNEADVTFVEGMIPHHEGAIEMSELAEDRTDNPEILALAERIEQAQGPEIEQMTGWLDAWGVDRDAGTGADGHGDMAESEMPGMGTQDMHRLGKAEGAEFDRLFLNLMIEHHQGAVDMSATVLDKGDDPEVAALAERIIADQRTEIEEMRSLRDS